METSILSLPPSSKLIGTVYNVIYIFIIMTDCRTEVDSQVYIGIQRANHNSYSSGNDNLYECYIHVCSVCHYAADNNTKIESTVTVSLNNECTMQWCIKLNLAAWHYKNQW